MTTTTAAYRAEAHARNARSADQHRGPAEIESRQGINNVQRTIIASADDGVEFFTYDPASTHPFGFRFTTDNPVRFNAVKKAAAKAQATVDIMDW